MEPSLVMIERITGPYKYSYADEALEQNINLAKQKGLSLAIIAIDINYFENLQKEFGILNDVVKLVSQKVAELLKATFRSNDTICVDVGLNFLYFLVILPNISRESAYESAEKLRLAIKSLEIKYNAQIIPLTASFAVAGFPLQGKTATSLLLAAKGALYKTKSNGGDRVCLAEMPIIDELTGLYHFCYAQEALEQNINLAKQKDLSMAIILLDIDHFKNINNWVGHPIGDIVLQKVAELLKTHFRDSDIPCRYGGDEFLVILPNASCNSAYKRAEELRLAIKSLEINYSDHILPLTASFGIACFPEHGETVDQIINKADAALYKAKRDGRDQVCQCQQYLCQFMKGEDLWNSYEYDLGK